MLRHGLSLAEEYYLLFGGQSLLGYLNDLNARGYIAAMYLADEITQATYTGTFAGTILRNAGYTSGPGAELVTNGGFNTDLTGWVAQVTPTTLEWSAGRAHVVGDAAGDGIKTAASLTGSVGETFRVSFDYEVISGTLEFIANSTLNYSATYTGSGSVTIYYILNVAPVLPVFRTTGGAGEFYIDNVSIKLVGQLDAAIGGTTPWLAGGGLSFDGLTSYGKVLNNAALSGLTNEAGIMIAAMADAGESNKGRLYSWDNSANVAGFDITLANRFSATIDLATTDATALYDTLPTFNQKQIYGFKYDDTAKTITLYHAINGALTALATGSAGVGARAARTTFDYYIGNNLAANATMHGSMFKYLILNAAGVAQVSTILTNLTALAGV